MYFHYCHKLRFDEAPDYTYLKELFGTLFKKLNYEVSDIDEHSLTLFCVCYSKCLAIFDLPKK